ncbi:MAG: hypothetical protein AB1422_10955 [bacterium]
MNSETAKKIEIYISREEWRKARLLISRELKKSPDDHWLVTRLGSIYYEEYEYEKSLELSEKAMKLAPKCPLVLWDYAGSLDMVNKNKEAIAIWKKLLKKGVEAIAYGDCGEGVRWARSLLNDCRYRISRSYEKLGNISASIRFLEEHIANRSPGIPSIYDLSVVKRELSELLLKKGGGFGVTYEKGLSSKKYHS